MIVSYNWLKELVKLNVSPEKLAEEKAQFKYNEMLRHLPYCPEPTYQFEVGQTVKIGCLENVIILEKLFDGKIYKIEYDRTERIGYNTYETTRDWSYHCWYDVRPNCDNDYGSFIENRDVRIHYMHMTMDSIFSKKYYFGIDMDPDYQRGYEWTLEDKQKLIDSIFKNIDIGKFAFIHRQYNQGSELYEILDGKQRINALCEFYENRFPYRGRYFNDLSAIDRNHFCHYGIDVAQIAQADKVTVLKYFLMLNTGGKQISEEHLAKIEKMYYEEKSKS